MLKEESASSKVYLIYLIGAFVCLIIGQQLFHLSGQSHLSSALNNALHTPWFFAVTLIIWYSQQFLFSKFFPTVKISFIWFVITCILLCLLLAVGTEALQMLSSRDPSFSDIRRDMFGMGSALCLIFLLFPWQKCRMGLTAVFAIGVVGFLSLGFVEFARMWVDVSERKALAPYLVSFNQDTNRIEGPVIRTGSDLSIVEGPDAWLEFTGLPVAKMTLSDQWPLPGLNLSELYSDWSSYEWLTIKVFVEGDDAIPFTVRVKTFARNREDISIVEEVANPGKNMFKIAIDDMIVDREGVVSDILGLRILSEQAYSGRTFYVGEIKLEP